MNHLMPSLLDKQGLSDDTVITAYHMSKDIYGKMQRKVDQFTLVNVYSIGGQYQLKLKTLLGSDEVMVRANDVVALDGMDPERFVDIYDINPDGSTKQIGKKRGRKPKDYCV